MRWVEPFPRMIHFRSIPASRHISESLSWAMWGERSPEISVIGLDDPALAEALIADKGWWMDAETASNELRACLIVTSNAGGYPPRLDRQLRKRADLERSSATRWTMLGRSYEPSRVMMARDAKALARSHLACACLQLWKCQPSTLMKAQGFDPAFLKISTP